MKLHPCPACSQLTPQSLLFSKNGCAILRCEECGLGRADASGFDPEAYYTGEYFSGGHADGYADYRGAEPVLRREFARTVAFVRRHRARGRLLELGCAYGFFLQEAARHFEVAGIELAQEAAAFGRQRGLHVLSGVAADDNLERIGAVDVLVLLDVIEHLPDPHATLELCTRRLNPGGIVVLTTGDFSSLHARLAGARWRLMTPPQHLWFFTRTSVERLARSLGLRLETLDHPWKIAPFSLVLFQVGRMLGYHSRREAMTSSAAMTSRAGLASRFGIPINLFDAMRVVLRKDGPAPSVPRD